MVDRMDGKKRTKINKLQLLIINEKKTRLIITVEYFNFISRKKKAISSRRINGRHTTIVLSMCLRSFGGTIVGRDAHCSWSVSFTLPAAC